MQLKTIFSIFTITFLTFSFSGQSIAETKTQCDNKNETCTIYVVKQNGIDFEVLNKTYASRTIKLTFKSDNLTSSEKINDHLFLKAKEKRLVSFLTPTDKGKNVHLESVTTSVVGDISKNPKDYAYGLPFVEAGKFKLIQAFNNKTFTHNTPLTNYALDFAMPEGTEIIAARAGKVIDVEASYSKGGPDKSLKQKVNYIYVEHDDGTFAAYLHLKKDGAVVKEGDSVMQGQLIGYSGFTGYANEPHLHFAIIKGGMDMIERSIPFKFKTNKSTVSEFKKGMYF